VTSTPQHLPGDSDALAALITCAPFGLYVVDADFRVSQISAGCEKVFSGIGPLIGRDVSEILHIVWAEPFASEAISRFRHTLETGEPYHSPDTTEQRANVRIVESYDWQINRIVMPDGRNGVLCFFYETTVHVHAAQDARFLSDFSEQIRTGTNADSVCSDATTAAARFLRLRWCGFKDGEAAPDLSAFADDLRNGRAVALNADGGGADAMVAMPLLRHDQWVSTLLAIAEAPRVWQPREINLLETVAERAWDAAERIRLHAELLGSEAKYRQVFDSIDEGFSIVELLFDDHGRPNDYRVIEINRAFERLTGLTDAIGRTARELVPDLEQFWFDVYGGVALTGEPAQFERHIAPLERWFHVHVTRIGAAADRRVAIVFNNITDRKRADQVTLRAARMDGYRITLADALRSLRDPIEIKATASAVLGNHLSATRVMYFEVDAGSYLVERDFTVPPALSLVGAYPTSSFGDRLLAAYRAGKTFVAATVAEDAALSPAEKAAYASVRVGAYIGIPLVKQGELVAGLAVHSEEPRLWTADEVALAEDTAERTWAAVERARTEAALRESDRRKDEFLAMLAHELRNPLAPIRNAVEILKATGGSSTHEQHARAVIERQIQHMSRLVDDLLDVSRITQGKVALRRETVALAKVVSNAVEATRSLMDARRQHLTVSTGPDPILVNADLTRLIQVLVNLLDNASKFTPEGGQIWIEARSRDGLAVLSVRDDGAGLPADLVPHVFELFRQADRSLDRTRGGLGIGLTIVRSLVELHDGTVQAASAGPGLGSEFQIALPLAAGPEVVESAAAPKRPAVQNDQKPRILIVEDNDDSAEMLSTLLRLNGYDTRTAADAGAALDLAGTFVPHVVLCDIGLPGVDGYELAVRLRQLQGRRCRLVALTGYGQVEDRKRAADAGFDHHLTKPVEPDALLALLESA